ncbi:MAG: hypothetical protein HKP21_08455, partial [Xanthomonadales bacterium]|nr:hypothetical protein [Gammaproteobacteria bacterium]NNK04570.1 hypothetical protein [Xanthomonadales bacterium]
MKLIHRFYLLPACTALLVAVMLVVSPASFAQTDKQMAKMAQQAEILAAAPRLGIGENTFSAEALADGELAWVEVEQNGLYTLSVSQPGALILSSFPTEDGRYDGRTKPQQHASAKSLDNPLNLGPVLLSRAHPYLVSISGQAAAIVTLTLDELLEPVTEMPQANTPVKLDTVVYESTATQTSKLPDSHPQLKIQVLADPRATLNARVGYQRITSAGMYPWAADSAAPVQITASVTGGPPPLVLLRITEFDGKVDETEPNHSVPNPLDVNAPFDGVLLPGADKDFLAFSLDSAQYLTVQVESALPQARFDVALQSSEGNKTQLLWKRQSSSATLNSESLEMAAGDYRLDLQRRDGDKAPA